MKTLTGDESLNLKKLIDQSECEDNTPHIRSMKHSALIHADVLRIVQLKDKHRELASTDHEKFADMCRDECRFLHNGYTDLFHRAVRDELDLTILGNMLSALKLIEEGEVDQHLASALVGKFLKELYIDSSIKRGENLDRERERSQPATDAIVSSIPANPIREISWKQYKTAYSTPSVV